MTESKTKAIVGEMFEDMSISEMKRVQGSGDVETDSILFLVSAAVLSGGASAAFSILVTKTAKGHC